MMSDGGEICAARAPPVSVTSCYNQTK